MLNILDLSAAQGRRALGNPIIWSDVAKWRGVDGERIDGVILKATEGNAYVDPSSVENVAGASAVDLLLGWYHFAHPDTVHFNDPIDEAAHFFDTVRAQGFKSGRHILALDIEEARNIHKGSAFVLWVLEFCEEIERLSGQLCVIYTGGPFFDSESGAIDESTQTRLARHPLWLAAYVTNPDRFIPKPWKTTGRLLHQESGDVAPPGLKVLHVAGIGRGIANVDHDVFNGTIDELYAFIESLVFLKSVPPPQFDPFTHAATTLADNIHSLSLPDDDPTPTSPQTPASKIVKP
jgi:hypothetical protein